MTKLFKRKKNNNMAAQVTTVKKILEELNGVGKTTPWVEVPGVYSVSSVSVIAVAQVNTNGQAMVLKLFINNSTGEIKYYIAKWLDIPEAKLLP